MYQSHRYLVRYLFALLLFGFNGIIASHISLGSSQIVLLRSALGSVSLLMLFFLSGHRLSFAGRGKDAALVLLSGAAMGASWMLLYAGYQTIGVSMSSLLYYCGPVMVMALSPLAFHERLTWVKLAGLSCVCIGVLLVNGTDGDINPQGFLFGLLSAVCYAVMLILNKKAVGVDGMENSLLQLTSAAVTVFAVLLLQNGLNMSIPAASWPWILLLGIVSTGFGCWCYFSSIGALSVQTVAVCGYIEPLSAVAFSALLLRERMTPLQIIGAALILGGALFTECLHKQPCKA